MDQRAWRAVIPDEAAEAGGALVGRIRADRGLGRGHGCQQRGPGCVRTDDSRFALCGPRPKAPGRCPRQLTARLRFLRFPSASSLPHPERNAGGSVWKAGLSRAARALPPWELVSASVERE